MQWAEEQPEPSEHLYVMDGVLLASPSHEPDESIAIAEHVDHARFHALVARYHAELLRVCYVILGDAQLAEDAAQSAWVKAWRKRHQLRDEGKIRPWLLAVAANEARQLSRRLRRARQTVPLGGYGGDADPRLTDLATALSRLSPEDRRLIGLRYVAELTSGEIGASLGVSAGAVRHRLMRLLVRLKKELR
jgi:RNA polymerase sigma-70 factor (ECF subfamily)